MPSLAAAALGAPVVAAAQGPTFNAFISTPKGGEPWFQPSSAAIGDFNGDGRIDAIVTDGSYNAVVRLMLGNGAGSFTRFDVAVPPSQPIGNPTPGMIRAADLNGDGRLDAVFVSPQGNLAPVVMLNTGNVSGVPQFTSTTYTPAYSGLRSVTIGDLNADGRPDFIVGNAYGSLWVYLNNGNGTFAISQVTNLLPNIGGSTGQGVIADLNGDGTADYVVSSNQTGAINVFAGNGNGTLQTPASIPSDGQGLAVADVNHDGRPDLLTVNGVGLKVYLNGGAGAFGAAAFYAIAGAVNPNSVTVADINGDGAIDAISGNADSNNVAVMLGDGAGAFGAATLYAVNQRPFDVSVADFNGDGKVDISTVGWGDRTFGVLTNTTPAALPTQTLTILGGVGNYGDVAANVEYFNPATNSWQQAYLVGGHPWGQVAGTTSWINYKPSNVSDPGAGPTANQTLWYLYRVRFTVPADAINPQMSFSLKADNFAQVAINGVTTGGSTQYINYTNMANVIAGGANQVNSDATFSQAIHTGENTITINMGDFGGLNGFNFRIDLKMQSSAPIEVVPVAHDTTAPAITAPGNIVKEATSAAGAVATFTATATDDVDGPVAVTANPVSGSTFAIGNTTVNLSAADAAGNTATASFIVTVQDTIAPVVTAPASIVAEATSANGAAVTYPAATATDAVGVTSITSNPPSGSIFPIGNTTVTATAKDAAGNIGGANFSVSVVDTTAPLLSVPGNQTLEATSAAGAVATFVATATDTVGVTSLTYSTASGATFAIGTTTVNVTAKDAAGNTSTGSFTITVRDTTAPAIASVTPSQASLWPPNHQMVAISVNAVSSDAVGVASLKIIAVTSSEPDNGLGDGDTAGDFVITGPLSVNLRAERGGKGDGRTYTITVEARDAAGNVTTKTCTVSVPKSQGGK